MIPEYELLNESKSMKDTRLQKNLTVEEFIVAFHKHKRIHCSRFPWRQAEMDQYEANIVEISRVFGPKFYEYHKQFTQRCAAALALGKKVNWAEKDEDLLQMIIGGGGPVLIHVRVVGIPFHIILSSSIVFSKSINWFAVQSESTCEFCKETQYSSYL